MTGRAIWLAARSAGWTLLLPGVVAGYVPWRFFGVRDVRLSSASPREVLSLVLICSGAALLLACIWEFARSGRGTLSPVDPARDLVVQGLYRYVRNPMYLSVTVLLLGEALLTRSPALLLYWAIWFGFVNLFVIAYEEPGLRRRFGESYVRYCAEVGRWVPRLPAQKKEV